MRKIALFALAFACATLGAAPAANAGDTVCIGVLTGAHDNVVVPAGAACTLQNATVQGNVLALPNSTLQINASTIRGNVEGDQTRHVLAQFVSQIGGNFHVKAGLLSASGTTGFDINVRVGGDALIEGNRGVTFVDAAIVGGDLEIVKNFGRLEIEFNRIEGNLKVEENFVPNSMSVLGNGLPFASPISGNLQVFKNIGPGAKQVVSNVVSQNLQCFENTPPFVGGPNVARDRQGQCF
jgi:hypothetical protein